MANLALITHPDCLRHSNGPYHPENAVRLEAIFDHLIATGLDSWLVHLEAPQATREDLLLAHETCYVDRLFELAPTTGRVKMYVPPCPS